MSDYEELKAIAEKATPGPWWVDSHGMTMMSMEKMEVIFNHPAQGIAVRNEETGNLSHWRNDWDASFIAAANPKTVLALIDEIECLQAKTGTTMGVGAGDGSLFVHGDYDSIKAAQAIVLERDQLKAEVARSTEREIMQLAEVEYLRKAASEVLNWTEAKHRPPIADQFEHGRMALVRLHALADLHAAISKESL